MCFDTKEILIAFLLRKKLYMFSLVENKKVV